MQETKTFVAYSMKVAQEWVEAAVTTGEDFRKKQPDLFYLGGITKPWAVVLDSKTDDWILVGERDPKSSVLTLDDWVVALRARFMHADEDPGVTIDPQPCRHCLKVGKKEACLHSSRQRVQFFGGLENTHFGQVCYEADWLMKKVGLSLERLPVEKLKTYYELYLEQHRRGSGSRSLVQGRFWFYPIVNRVNVFSDLVLLERFQLGVFTETLYAEVDGMPVTNLAKLEDYPSEGFSRSFSENFDAVAQSCDVFDTLRGLTRLASLAKGLSVVEKKPRLDFIMAVYPPEQSRTATDVEVLSIENREVGFEIHGGVQLAALAARFMGGDASGLLELVLKARLKRDALSWTFDVTVQDGQLAGVFVPAGLGDPSQGAAMFAQAVFLQQKKRYKAAIECYERLLACDPDCVTAYNNRGVAYKTLGDYENAKRDYSHSLHLSPFDSGTWSNLGNTLFALGRYREALDAHDKALSLNAYSALHYSNRAITYQQLGQFEDALKDFAKALDIDPRSIETLQSRGAMHLRLGNLDAALSDFQKAIEYHPNDPQLHYNLGCLFYSSLDFARCVDEHSKAVAVDPGFVEAYFNRAVAYDQMNRHQEAIRDYYEALHINPKYTKAYLCLAESYERSGEYENAVEAYGQFVKKADSSFGPYVQQARWKIEILRAQKSKKQ